MRAFTLAIRTLVVLVAAAAAIVFVGCNDSSNDVTGPAMGAAADVSGTWSGDFDSYAPASCASRSAAVSLTQSGNQVHGTFKVVGCGIDGVFRATVSGNTVSGSVGMLGCTGGAVSGRLENGSLSLTVGDFRKELIAGEAEVLPGGIVRLQR